MKKSRIAKFALLGASAAALAATLSTSTYAWYVSNKQADIEAGSGTTGTAETDGSILLSWTGNNDTWFKTLNFQDSDSTLTGTELSPTHYVAGTSNAYGAFYAINDTNGGKGAESTKVIKFSVYIISQSNVTTITPTITLSNWSGSTTQVAYADNYKLATTYDSEATYYKATTDATGTTYTETTVADATAFAAGTFYVAQDAGLPTKVQKGKTFSVHPKYSTYVQQNLTPTAAAATLSYYQVDGDSSANNYTDGNAHSYYEAVSGVAVGAWAQTSNYAEASANGLSTFGLTAGTAKKIDYVIFLDGGDTDCFNSAAGYSFNFDLKFEVTTA